MNRICRIALLSFGLLLSGCADFSDVTDPATREDFASWYNEGTSSMVVEASSSSVVVVTSSGTASSSSVVVAVSSSSVASDFSYGTLTDSRDGQTYNTVAIGTQTWMAENLAYLPSVNAETDSSTTVAKYYVYDYSGTSVSEAEATSNYTTYGVLYNWTAANSACPSGWHLPTSDEWDVLEEYVGGSAAGTKLKANSSLWSTNAGTDNYGFSALPGGYYSGSDFSSVGIFGRWWTATESSS
ncbi:MAG TPA: FISUMP domain-containing protein, partial [Fibrobacteraceae bacterium]|nr:FISUMP domain-containing protein [Fibrobacteraceae bacterium]